MKIEGRIILGKPSQRGHRALFAAASLLLWMVAIGVPGKVWANGWEHLAIPRESLLAALESGDPHTMEHAAISLGIRGEARDVEPLIRALEDAEGEHHLRAEIYRALGLIGDVSAAPTLRDALKSEWRPELRAIAAASLGGVGSADSIPALLEALEEDERAVRQKAIDALGAFDRVESIAALSKLALSGESGATRRRALRALGATGSAKATEPLLSALARAEDDATRAVIIDALANVAPREAIGPLAALLDETTNPTLQVKLAVALGVIGGEGTVPTLAGLLSSEDRAVQRAAVRMLAEARSAGAVPSLMQLYDELARLYPTDAVGLPPNAASALDDFDLMKATVRALLQSDPPGGLPAFVNAAGDRHFDRGSGAGLKLAHRVYELRRVAIHALGYTQALSVTPMLRKIVKSDPDPRLRSVAMRSLGVLEAADAEHLALEALLDEDASVRTTAATVLGRLGTEDALPALLEALGDSHPHVRSQAALSTGLLGDERAAQVLQALLGDEEDDDVRESARQALVMLAADRR